jgi:hypothetical protein
MARSPALLLFLLAAACGGRASATGPAPVEEAAAPPPDAAPPLDDCADACTEIAVCYEEVYQREYNQGGNCTVACEGQLPEEREAFFACVAGTSDRCTAMVEC